MPKARARYAAHQEGRIGRAQGRLQAIKGRATRVARDIPEAGRDRSAVGKERLPDRQRGERVLGEHPANQVVDLARIVADARLQRSLDRGSVCLQPPPA